MAFEKGPQSADIYLFQTWYRLSWLFEHYTLLKFRKQALKMQKAYKLYFSANLQLVIGKRFQKKKKKKILCVTCPSPYPKLK